MASETQAWLTSIVSTAQLVELGVFFLRPGRDWTADARTHRETQGYSPMTSSYRG
jgi:hypothetical protein